ncbi:MAG: hypothetical protein IH608_00675 [Proteobacteria bacterium]|nr:hypothetical protein [Pseudomonadota bacterium]
MSRLHFPAALLALALLLPWVPARAGGNQLNTALGQPFPDMTFATLLTADDYGALGLPRQEGPFRLSEVPGSLLVLEFFNRYCLTCQRQAAYLNSFFKEVSSGDLAGRIHVLSVGLGNRSKELAQFRQEVKAGYPIAPDPLFDRLVELGDPGGTPFTVFLLRQEGNWVLADYHLGLQGDTELMARSRVLLEGRAGVIHAPSETAGGRRHPPLDLSPGEEQERAQKFLSRVAGKPVAVETLTLSDGTRVYAQGKDAAATGLYARVGSRDPVCDVCHAVHFLFAFDGHGRVRGFEPIHVTKYGNELWSPSDVARMNRALAGKAMAELRFDPEVDSVTSATMSSALIFDEIRRSTPLLDQLLQP